MSKVEFIPALKFRVLTPLLDLFLSVFMREREIKSALLQKAEVASGFRVLDFGSGTGTLLLMLESAIPGTEIHGVDVDPGVLKIARRKLQRVNSRATLVEYDGANLPYTDGHFDRVLSTLVFHHLSPKQKSRCVAVILRIIRPGGRFLLLDFGQQRSFWGAMVTGVLRRLEPLAENLEGKLPRYLETAGFIDVRELGTFRTLLGDLSIHTGTKPLP